MSRPQSNRTPAWDESRWEEEIRRDELRINCYFQTLPQCLDLPGEEEMLAETISARPELKSGVPGMNVMSSAWSYLSGDFPGAPEPEDDDENEDLSFPPRRPGESVVETIDALASAWNSFCAVDMNPFCGPLSAGCAYARLLARTADFLDVPENNPALKRCLGKRALADLEQTVDVFEVLKEAAPERKTEFDFHLRRLSGVREQLNALLAKVK